LRALDHLEDAMKKTLASALLTLVMLTSAATILSACNTMAGAGRDVSAAGHAVTNEAVEHNPE
jgi:predicted small secreted protein